MTPEIDNVLTHKRHPFLFEQSPHDVGVTEGPAAAEEAASIDDAVTRKAVILIEGGNDPSNSPGVATKSSGAGDCSIRGDSAIRNGFDNSADITFGVGYLRHQ